MSWIRRFPEHLVLLLFLVLWSLFFWRIYTPNQVDAVSLKEGDFSAQFVSWTSYAAERWSNGELALWNPYMHAGAPFLADPQTALMYPPRQLTLTLLAIGGDFSGARVYQALQIEMTVHVLLGVIFMYAFLRLLTYKHDLMVSKLSSIAGAAIWGFGGYLNAYPQLQLPILETAIWFPLILFCIHLAAERSSVKWTMGAGITLALAILAGHPQTFVLMGYAAVAYFLYRMRHQSWRKILKLLVIFGMVAAGLSAVQLLPTLEFQQITYRQGFSIDDKSNGFALQDILQILFPRMLGEWSPLYVGISSVLLIGLVVSRQQIQDTLFWIFTGAIGLILSFGNKFALYQVLYVLLPGFSLFRGQERNVILVVMAACVLVAFSLASLVQNSLGVAERRYLRLGGFLLVFITGGFAIVFFFLRLMPPNGEIYQIPLQASIYSLLMVLVSWALLDRITQVETKPIVFVVLLVGLLVFDLFSVNLNNSNFEPIPASERLPEPQYISLIQANLAAGQRVEGLRGIRDSYGALYRVPDIWGNSPLRLDSIEFYLWQLPIEQRWELLGVQVVNSEWEMLPRPYQLLGSGQDIDGPFMIYQLTDPRPFAHLIYNVRFASSEETRSILADLSFSLRDTVLLLPEDKAKIPNIREGEGSVAVNTFLPEYIALQASTNTDAVLSLALPYINGWRAEIDGQPAEILKAYDGLMAVVLPSGTHTIILRYQPLSFLIGAGISIISLLVVVISLGRAYLLERAT
ncbi:MAG: hypothetical protein CUN55_06715 [Phototrophicales bacterium]|nr:MAG: hypothetical protein CUN55_06715 [Phototrophicales bacterium]